MGIFKGLSRVYNGLMVSVGIACPYCFGMDLETTGNTPEYVMGEDGKNTGIRMGSTEHRKCRRCDMVSDHYFPSMDTDSPQSLFGMLTPL